VAVPVTHAGGAGGPGGLQGSSSGPMAWSPARPGPPRHPVAGGDRRGPEADRRGPEADRRGPEA